MNLIENLVQTAAEEAAELAVAFSKGNRFSLQSIDPKTEKPSHQTIVAKMNDVLAVIELLRDRGVVLAGIGDPAAVGEAKKKFVEHLEISQKAGALTLSEDDNNPKPGVVIGGANEADTGLPTEGGENDEGTDPSDLTNTDATGDEGGEEEQEEQEEEEQEEQEEEEQEESTSGDEEEEEEDETNQ